MAPRPEAAEPSTRAERRRILRFYPALYVVIPIALAVCNVINSLGPYLALMVSTNPDDAELLLLSARSNERSVSRKNRAEVLNLGNHVHEKRNQRPKVVLHKGKSKSSSDEDCCFAPSFNAREKFDKCKAVCFTKWACNDTNYPFSSMEERIAFAPQVRRTRPEQVAHRESCRLYQSHKPPENHWCGDQTIDGTHSLDHHQLGCSTGSFMNMYVFPQGKLALCGIPKAGITQWLQFLRFYAGANDYLSFPHFKQDVNPFKFNNLSVQQQLDILNDSEWTKAVFIRNPAERLLSAYLDKVQTKQDPPTFSEFVNWISISNATCPSDKPHANKQHAAGTPGLNWCTNPHWRPQVWSCGLSEYLSHYQFVGRLDEAASETKLLLERVGLWETHGKHYRTKVSKSRGMCSMEPPLSRQVVTGFQQIVGKNGTDGSDVHGHAKFARARFDEYYTPELLKRVKKLYAMDYELWDLLQKHNGVGASGPELVELFCEQSVK